MVDALLDNGAKVVNIFPQSGLAKRSKEELRNYASKKAQFAKTFMDIRVNEVIDSDFIGATYLVKTENGEEPLFAIRSSQANSPKSVDDRRSLWLGALSQSHTASLLSGLY
ncbi:MAG: hypothetical protein OXE99_11575 [Cellvibrionales bacterium]|nr:hypothetical protein [Cellvibrionales bacterium]